MNRLMLSLALAIAATTILPGCGASATDSSQAEADVGESGASAEELAARRFTLLKRGPTDAHLASLFAAGATFESAYLGVYRFHQVGSEATDPAARMKRVKEVMHRYMCSFFDESIDLGRPTGSLTTKVSTTLSDIDMASNGDGQDAHVTAFSGALLSAFKDAHLDVMSGSASGNNTMGEVMGVYDVAHDEILYFGFTNCGSDD